MINIQKNIPLAPYTTFKIGGPARFFVEAKNEEEIAAALEFAKENKLPVFVLGGGSNVLVSDKGFNGLVIKIQNSKFKIPAFAKASAGRQNFSIECGAGVALSKIVNESVKAGFTGLEWAVGIPGTIGGAVRGNAGAFGGTMGEIVKSVSAFEISNFQFPISNKNLNDKIQISNQTQNPKSKNIFNLNNKECNFDYRNSIFKKNQNLIILSVNLKLKKGDRGESEKRVKEILAARKEKQPMNFPSAGSFFQNPLVKNRKLIKDFEIDTNQKIKDNKIPAGYFIDLVGLRGKKVGGAMFSEKHANFILNTGKATADNVLTLVAMAKTRVRDKYGIQLNEEVQLIGF